MADTKRGRERKHLGKETQWFERDIEYAARVARGEVSEEPPLLDDEPPEMTEESSQVSEGLELDIELQRSGEYRHD